MMLNNVSTTYTADNVNRYTATNAQSPTYDADGNMITYNGMTFGWDGENRLVSVTGGGSIPDEYTYSYDYANRRIREYHVEYMYDSNGGAPIIQNSDDQYLVYDGWNLIEEFAKTGTSTYTRNKWYVWGEDLSGTLQGAGGVGGLLYCDSGAGVAMPIYDVRGNIMHYINPGGEVAGYTYDAFLNRLSTSGNADSYRFQASTKSYNAQLGMLDYQLRTYLPSLGRWIQEDPIEEQGGVNLYGFVNNNPVRII